MFWARLFCVAIFCLSNALGEICFDEECLNKGANEIYALVASDVSLNPIHLDFVEGDVTTLKYKLFNATLSGLKNCHINQLRLSINDTKLDYSIGCPHLILEAGYEMKGHIESEFVEGKGSCKIDHYDYNLLVDGNYKKTVRDGNLYVTTASYVVDIEAKGKVHYDFKNLYYGDKNKSDAMHKFANENWSIVDKLFRQPAMEAFMSILVHAFNAYLEVTPAEVHYSKKT